MAIRAARAINRHLILLGTDPEMGRPSHDLSELRELIIPFGDSGYVLLYHFDKKTSLVLILACRHQKEAGY